MHAYAEFQNDGLHCENEAIENSRNLIDFH